MIRLNTLNVITVNNTANKKRKEMMKMSKNKKKNNNNNNNNTSLALTNTNTNTNTDKGKEVSGTSKSTTPKTTTYSGKYSGKTSSWSTYYNRKNYDFKGKKNETSFPEFVEICKLTQDDLKVKLGERLMDAGYAEVISGDGYLYAKGTVPVLLTAHMDTVHKLPVRDFYEYYDKEKEQHIISSPQGIGGDDRCGVYMILEIIKTHKCSVLFCEDEEIGGIGSDKFCKSEFMVDLEKLNYLIELDRTNGTDAVFYDCGNNEFTKFIEDNTGYEEAWGSFSDISNLSPDCMVASVNLSCGYYNAHTTSEYVIIEEMLNTIEVVKKLLEVKCKQFEYIDSYGGYYYGGYSNNLYRRYYWDDDDYYDYYDSYYNKNKHKNTYKSSKEKEISLFIYIADKGGEISTYISNAKTYEEAFGKFFIKNPNICFSDVYDYEIYDEKIYDDGWYDGLYY